MVAPRQAPARAPLSSVVLIGCVKSKLPHAAPAQDLYTGALFTRRRRHAENTGKPWFILSSRWGLVAPDEVIAPYNVYLGDMPSTYRRPWAEFVVAQLATRLALSGAEIELHAGDHYVNALRPAMERSGAVVTDPVNARSLGQTLTWYDAHLNREARSPALPIVTSDVDGIVQSLVCRGNTLTPGELRGSPRASFALPGLYSWWVDTEAADDLSRGLGQCLEPGLIYAGLAGATRWPSGTASTNTLWGRLVGMHLGGRVKLSTFRTTLGAILAPSLWSGLLDEGALTAWMDEHLSVVPVPVNDADRLGLLETDVLDRLDPPPNLSKMAGGPIRTTVTRLRRELHTG